MYITSKNGYTCISRRTWDVTFWVFCLFFFLPVSSKISKILAYMLQWHTWSIFANCFWFAVPHRPLLLHFDSSFLSCQRSSGGYFWRWMQWAVLTCVMQFHDQFEIIIPLNNSWISLFVSAILKLCLGWMWKPLHHLQVNANLIYFYYGFYVGL